MATAKLWWNGSAWATSSAYWANTSKNGNRQLGVTHRIMIAAYDDNTILMSQSFAAYQTASIYFSYGMGSTAVTVKSESTTIGSGTFSGKDVTPYTKFSYSGSASANGVENYTTHSSGDISFSGSTTITSPFRTITFDVNGGSGSPGTQTVLTGIESTITPASAPTRTHYVFAGWNTKADGSGDNYSTGAAITITEDVLLYAQWSQTAFAVTIEAEEGTTITFNGQSFSGVATTEYVEAGTYAVTIRANAGYILKTRSPASDGNVTISDDTTVLSATSQHVGCRIDDGESWVQSLIYVDDGTDWVMAQAYYDNGSEWILLN